ncbi:MAG TPA: alpha/beta hydrolase [Gemmatimonadaceae bacterium]
MAEIKIDGKHAYYHDGGVAWKPGQPALVFLHGAGCTHSFFQAQSRALAHQGYNVAVLDLPGHGHSDDATIATMEDYAAWVLRLIQALKLAPAHIIGHSMGAAIGVSLAAQHPDAVQSLALIGTGIEMKGNPALIKACLENQPHAVAMITSFAHGRAAHLGTGTIPGAWVMGMDKALIAPSAPPVLQRDFVVCDKWNGAALAPQVRCPTLVLSGAGDRMTPPRSGKQLADAIPGARYDVVPVTGHMLPTEAPRLVLKKLTEWLGGLKRKAA